jgi:uncharacterized protein (DUF2141 family)
MGMKANSATPLFLVLLSASCSTTPRVPSESVEPTTAGLGTLVVEIAGLRTAAGKASVSLFDGVEGFPQDTTAVFKSATVQLTHREDVAVRFENLGYGDYAIAVLHDENGNGVMDTGFLGIPSEGFGFSNNPRPGFGAPSFETCQFRLDRPEVTLRL